MTTRQTADQTEHHETRIGENIRGAIIVVLGAAALVGISLGVMTVLTSPDGWITKAASQAYTTAQQGTLASVDFVTE